jgi:ABC-type microcin C transport system permease subunit YejE
MKRFILFLCLFPTSIFAQSLFESKPVLVYFDSTKYIEMSPYAAVLEDAQKVFSIEQVMAKFEPNSGIYAWRRRLACDERL